MLMHLILFLNNPDNSGLLIIFNWSYKPKSWYSFHSPSSCFQTTRYLPLRLKLFCLSLISAIPTSIRNSASLDRVVMVKVTLQVSFFI